MNHERIAVVMPAYNEASGICEFLDEIHSTFDAAGLVPLIGIVDDCSTDDTRETVQRLIENRCYRIAMQRNETNVGHGPSSLRAWRLGLEFETSVIVHVDGDGQFDGDDILKVARACQSSDGAIGVRKQRDDPWFRRFVTLGLRTYLRLVSGAKSTDANSPLRAYKAETVEQLLAATPEGALIPTVYFSVLGSHMGLDIREAEVTSHDRRGDSSVGSTWGEPKLPLLPSRRFVLFTGNALLESWQVLRRIRTDSSS